MSRRRRLPKKRSITTSLSHHDGGSLQVQVHKPTMETSVARHLLRSLLLLLVIPSGSIAVVQQPTYFDDIKPIFAIHCVKCHGPETQKGGLRLDLRDAIFAKSRS